MGNAFSAKDLEKSQEENLEVKEKRPMPEIIFIEFHFNGYREFIPAINLRPTRQPGNKNMDPLLSSQLNKVILIEQSRTRPDKTHIAFQDIDKLRQFIQT